MIVENPLAATTLDLGQLATAACLLEISAPKPGNVHRGADFADMTFEQMALAAVAIGPAIQDCHRTGVGAAILSAVRATQTLVGKNTNLGTVLLLAPLAAADRMTPASVRAVLRQLEPADSESVYQAIRLARPGGLGRSGRHDVDAPAPGDLIEAMAVASERDMVARQYTSGFAELMETIVPYLLATHDQSSRLPAAIVRTHVMTMAEYPDSLIARKLGFAAAQEAADRAADTLDAGDIGEDRYHRALADLDFWLRSDGHRRNPGTTADLIAAALFICLRSGKLQLTSSV